MTLDWNANFEPLQVPFQQLQSFQVPVTLRGVLLTVSESKNSGATFCMLIAEIITIETDHEKKESIFSLLDQTKYGFFNIINARFDMGLTYENNTNVGHVIAAGKLNFKLVRSSVIEAVADSIEYSKCFLQRLLQSIFDAHSSRVKSITVSDFQFEDPFFEA